MAEPAGGSRKRAGKRSTIPLFPLQTVLLPATNLPLHIFEPRYRQLTVDLVTGAVPDREFGVIAIRTTMVREVDAVEHLYDHGCAAELREAKRLPDGRFEIATRGSRRFRLLDLDAAAAPYLLGTVEWVPDEPSPPGSSDVAERLSAVARAAHRRYCDVGMAREDWTFPAGDTEVGKLAYQLAAECLLPLDDRQLLLEERHPLRRLRLVCRLLTREAGFLTALRAVPAPLGELVQPTSMN